MADVPTTTEPKSLTTTIQAWPMKRKISLAAVALVSLGLFALLILQVRVADYRLLYSNLSDTDAGAVITWLKDQKIPYRLENGGRSIHVPANQVYEARLNLAGAGIPQGGGVGFELFDKQSFGMTDFAQKINYQRAIQGELGRTIASLAPVESARVMVALPEKRLFLEQQKEATASVILRLAPGRQLKEGQVMGVVHLVASSIEGLEPANVTVVDESGRVLTPKGNQDLAGPMSPAMLDFQSSIEQKLETRAQSLLDRALGSGNSMVRVTAEVDFSQMEKTEERFDPDGAVPRSEQVSTEKSDAGTSGGVPGVDSNLGQTGITAGSTNSSRSSETINYEISKVVSRTVAPVGAVKNLSVAVLVADKMTPGADGGEPTLSPRGDKELLDLENMIRSALGLEADRGDKISVVSMPFEEDITLAAGDMETAPALYQYMPFIKYGLLAAAGLFLYFMLVRPLVRTLQETRATAARPGGYRTVAELEGEMSPEEQALLTAEDPINRLRKQILASETPPTQVIRSWLNKP